MAKVQREQRIKTVNCGGGDVGCVAVCIWWENAAVKDFAGKSENRVGDFQKLKRCEQFQSRAGQRGVARAGFVEDDL